MTDANDHSKPTIEDIERSPQKLPEIGQADWETKFHEMARKFTEVTTRNGDLMDECNRLRLHSQTTEILNQLIRPYADKAFKFMVLYCLFVGEMLLLHGLGWGFALPESVLQLLVGSTAVTVIGLVGMVLTGVFVGARSK